jgi:hypothetical protein
MLWSRVILEKPIFTQLVKKSPANGKTRRFITVFTRFATGPILSQMIPVNILTSYLSNIHFKMTHPFMPISSSFKVFQLKLHTYYIPCPSHPPSFGPHNSL